MARPRTPTPVLELTGAFRKDPQRKREDPETSGAIGDPPKHFTQALADIWWELAANCPHGVLTNADRYLLEIASQLLLKFRTLGLLPGHGIGAEELKQLVSCLSRMGMTPADRSRVGVNTKKEQTESPFQRLARETRPVN